MQSLSNTCTKLFQDLESRAIIANKNKRYNLNQKKKTSTGGNKIDLEIPMEDDLKKATRHSNGVGFPVFKQELDRIFQL